MWIFAVLIITVVAAVFALRKQADQRTLNEALTPVGEVVTVRRYSRRAPKESPYHAGQGIWVHRAVVRTAGAERVIWLQTSARLGYRWCFDDARDDERRGNPEPPKRA